MASDASPTICEYYSGKSIFITGASGFIGKLYLEKVLRCCPDVKAIYCLMRPKYDQDVSQRLEKLLESSAFGRLHNAQPGFSSKIHVIHGDISENCLGMKECDRKLLENHVQIIVHAAATVRFDEHIRTATQMNILAVREMIALAKNMANLEAFIHVSTAYANCDREYIEERVYPIPMRPQQLIDILEWLDDEALEAITPNLIGPKPNTYTFSKHIGEALLIQEGSELPLVIVRPSIVTASWREPAEGWVDNVNGLSGFYIATGKGLLRTFHVDKHYVVDIIPVDIVVNVIAASAWYVAVKQSKNFIVQPTTSGINPLTWGNMVDSSLKAMTETIAFDECFRRPTQHIIHGNKLVHLFWTLVSHILPAYIVDCTLQILQRKPRMVRLYDRLNKAMTAVQYFTNYNWRWAHSNLDKLFSELSQEDKKTFYCDVKDINWQQYMVNYIMGTKKYILKEDESTMQAAWSHQTKLRNIRRFFNIIICITFWRLLMAKSHVVYKVWHFILRMLKQCLSVLAH